MMAHLASVRMTLLCILTVCAGGGCALISVGEDASYEHAPSLAFSLKNVVPGQDPLTKMSTSITQSNGEFRGIEHVYIIPFDTDSSPVVYEDSRLGSQNVVLGNIGISKSGLVANNNAHLFGSAFVPEGMNRVLVYGKAPDEGEDASKDSKHSFGVLTSEGLGNPSGSDDISFHLEPIMSTGEGSEWAEVVNKADELLDYLNVVMRLMGSSQNASIVGIFDAVKRENQIMACSYASFDQIRTEIQSALLRVPFDGGSVIEEIRLISTAISAFSSVLTAAGTSFPNQYGIPEGSIGFWWNGDGFVRLINSVNIALVDPTTYCYPPSLWYFANSAVKTSNNENIRAQYVPGNAEWSDILAFYTDGEIVNSFTQSVAIVDQLQYGVGMLELSLSAPGTDIASTLGGCRLTGIIIGDQKDVDFEFRPATGSSRFIYDTEVSGLRIGETGSSVQTLVLQTPDDTPVHFALEFRNTTGYTRHCQQGDILPWCKFYVAGVLDPNAEGLIQPSGEVLHSVFVRDRKTIVSVKIESLRNAYNTVPDLHSPQLEIGLVAEMKWTQVTPQSIILDF